MDESEKEEVRQKTDIVELVSRYTQLKRAGSKYKGLCPFHAEKTPSFNVDPEEGRWRCFGSCGEGGDVFKFIQKAENLTFPEAMQRLAEMAGITLTPRHGGDIEAAKRAQTEKEKVFAANAIALQFFRLCFRRDGNARAYAEGRGLAHQTLENFQVGWAPDDWGQLAEYLRQQKIHPEDAEKAGLIFPSKFEEGKFTDRFRGRLIFPIVDVQERVVGFGGRLTVPQTEKTGPKYLNSPETPVFSKSRILYGLNRARKAIEKADKVLIVEGYMDVVAAHQAGLEFVVATLGTALTEDHVRLIRRYTKTVVLSFDADDAGVKAALRAGELLGASGEDLTLRVLRLPPGEDPDSILKRGDVAGFHKAIDGAVTLPEFRLRGLESRHDTSNENGKLALLHEAVAIIAAVPSILQQDVLIRRMAAFHPSYALSSLRAEESLREEVRRAGGNRAAANGVGGDALDFGAPPPGPRPGYRNGGGGHGNGGGKWQPSNMQWQGGKRQQQRPFVMPDREPLPIVPPAASVAEQTILRALLSDEWFPHLKKQMADEAGGDVGPRLLSEAAISLSTALWTLIENAGLSPRAAAARLTDPALLAFADALRFAEDTTALTGETIDDALQLVADHRLRQRLDQIRREVGEAGEGNTPGSDELLRQWSERARRLKGGKDSETEE